MGTKYFAQLEANLRESPVNCFSEVMIIELILVKFFSSSCIHELVKSKILCIFMSLSYIYMRLDCYCKCPRDSVYIDSFSVLTAAYLAGGGVAGTSLGQVNLSNLDLCLFNAHTHSLSLSVSPHDHTHTLMH